MAAMLTVTIQAAGSCGSAVAQTRSDSSAGAKQTKEMRRSCAVDFMSAGLVPDKNLLAKPKPIYPESAKAKDISGSVFVLVKTDTEGNVASATISSGPPLLQRAALEAARQARFYPTKLSGVAIKVYALLRYDFILEHTEEARWSRSR